VMALLGALVIATVATQLNVFGREWDIHTMIAGAMLLIVGTQVVGLGLSAHAYGIYFMNDRDPWFERMRDRFRLEHGLLLGCAVGAVGLALALGIVVTWIQNGFGDLSSVRLALVAATLVIVGIQVVFTSFLISILGLRRR